MALLYKMEVQTDKIVLSDAFEMPYNKSIKWRKNDIIEGVDTNHSTFRFVAPTNNCSHEFIVGNILNNAQKILTINNTEVLARRTFKSNSFDSENNTDVSFKRNNVEFMRFDIVDGFSRVETPMRLALTGGLNESVIYEANEVTQNALRIWNNDTTLANSMVSIGVGAQPNVFFCRSNFAQCNEEFRVNTINTIGATDLVFQTNGVEYMRFDNSAQEINVKQKLRLTGGEGKMVVWENTESTNSVVRIWNNEETLTPVLDLGVGANGTQIKMQPDLVIINDAELRVNTINSNGDNNLVLQQNGTTIAFYDKDDVNYPSGLFKFDVDVSVLTSKFVQCNTLKAHIFDTHDSLEPNDVSFRYDETTYMLYDSSLSNLQLRTNIVSDSNIEFIDLTKTSDINLKTDIHELHSHCSDIIKKIKVKKFKYKDDTKKKNCKGYIAQDVRESIPTDIEHVVRDGQDHMVMNYGNMTCFLWKALQETLERVDKLEEEIIELKKPKPQAKAKEKKTTVEFQIYNNI